MTTSHDSLDTLRSAPSDDTHTLVGACLRLPKAFRRMLADLYDNDDPLWILVGPERDSNWNEWIVAYNEAASGDEWVVRRAVWWWGHYTDWQPDYTDWFVEPMYRAGEVEPAFDLWNESSAACRGLTRLYIMDWC